MRMVGLQVSDNDGRELIDRLQRIGTASDIELAQRIERGFHDNVEIFATSPEERDLILGALVDPPARLVELRCVLARDHRARQ